ncbi:MAG: hypothetical protein C5B49_05120 [Bdellovibrio sp.]|nr:MAG: hypothetical protein C5B49_05120 [Bdellovibrio sp.]
MTLAFSKLDKTKRYWCNQSMRLIWGVVIFAGIVRGEQKLPLPKAGSRIADYAKILKKAGYETKPSYEKKGDDGYGIVTDSLILPTGDFIEAYTIAQKIFGIPEDVQLPINSESKEQKIEIPHDKKIWEQSIKVKRDKFEINELTYYYRVEGGGTTGHLIKLSPNQIKIELSGISD